MNSITSYAKPDPSGDTLMRFAPACIDKEQQRKQLLRTQGTAFVLAALAHVVLWQLYQAIPPPPPPEEPPIIEASLVLAPPAPVAAAPAPPPPQVQQPPKPQPPKPQPKPKPLPKPDKPVVKKPDRPKPMPEAQTQAEAEPSPMPAVEEAPPAPVAAPKAAPRANVDSTEDTRLSGGSVSGFDRHSMPRIARERGWEGTTTLKFRILASGDIDGITVVGSSGYDVLDERAIEMLQNAHVTPCRRGDTPVDCPTSKVLPIQFRLERQ